MSGHSKWSTIKRQKEANDAKRGRQFTKLARLIAVAAKESGGDLDSNFKLRLAVEKAKQANMPKANIEKAIKKGIGKDKEAANWKEVVYEGFGPAKTSFIVECITDNTNRMVVTIRTLVERGGGTMGQPGSVSYGYDRRGYILINNRELSEEVLLKLMDSGLIDYEVGEEGTLLYTAGEKLSQVLQLVLAIDNGQVLDSGLGHFAKDEVKLSVNDKKRVIDFYEKLEELDEVQNVYHNGLM